MTTSSIYVKIQVPGFHCWPSAPNHLSFLRYPHRHMFTIKAFAHVKHADRHLEFFEQQARMRDWVAGTYDAWNNDWEYGVNFDTRSCEHIGTEFLRDNSWAYAVEVSEDGENGALIERAQLL